MEKVQEYVEKARDVTNVAVGLFFYYGYIPSLVLVGKTAVNPRCRPGMEDVERRFECQTGVKPN